MFTKQELEFLCTSRVCRIATIDLSNGFPHVVPICYVFDGKTFFTTLSRYSKRVENIKNGSKVTLVIDEYKERDGEWRVLRGLLIKTKVSLLDYHKNQNLFMTGWKHLMNRYPQYRQWANGDLAPKDPDKRLIMQLHPFSKVSWGFIS